MHQGSALERKSAPPNPPPRPKQKPLMTPEAETLIPGTGIGCCMKATCRGSAGHSCPTLARFLSSVPMAISSCDRVSSSRGSAFLFPPGLRQRQRLGGQSNILPHPRHRISPYLLSPLHTYQGTMENGTGLATLKLKSEKDLLRQRRCEMKDGSGTGCGSRFSVIKVRTTTEAGLRPGR